MLVSAREKSQQLIVWLWHGSGRVVFVRILSGCQCACGVWRGIRNQKLFLPPGEEYPKQSYSAVHWITLHFSSHLSFFFLLLFFFFFFPARTPQTPYFNEQTIQTHWGGSGLRAHSCISQESVSTRHHAEDTICRCWHDLVSVFWQSCIEEFNYSPPPSGVPCDILAIVRCPHNRFLLPSLHYTLPFVCSWHTDGKAMPEERHSLRTGGFTPAPSFFLFLKRRSTVDWLWADKYIYDFFFFFPFCFWITALIEWSKEGLSLIHMSKDSHLRTRNRELSGFLLIHSTVFKCFCYV